MKIVWNSGRSVSSMLIQLEFFGGRQSETWTILRCIARTIHIYIYIYIHIFVCIIYVENQEQHTLLRTGPPIIPSPRFEARWQRLLQGTFSRDELVGARGFKVFGEVFWAPSLVETLFLMCCYWVNLRVEDSLEGNFSEFFFWESGCGCTCIGDDWSLYTVVILNNPPEN